MKATCEKCGRADDGDPSNAVEKRIDGHQRPLLCWECYAEQLQPSLLEADEDDDEDSDELGTVLSKRQAQVWALKDSGLTQSEIADVLDVSVNTVKNTWYKARQNYQRAQRTVEIMRDPEDIRVVR